MRRPADEVALDVVDRFLEASDDDSDEQFARQYPYLYRALTRRTAEEVNEILKRALRPHVRRRMSVGPLVDSPAVRGPVYLVEEELETDLKEGRLRAAFVVGAGKVEKWTWKPRKVEPGDPADAYEPRVVQREGVQKETVADWSAGAEMPLAAARRRTGDRFYLGLVVAGELVEVGWVHASRLDRASAERLAADARRARPGRLKTPKQGGRSGKGR